jgi:hypothetical protein
MILRFRSSHTDLYMTIATKETTLNPGPTDAAEVSIIWVAKPYGPSSIPSCIVTMVTGQIIRVRSTIVCGLILLVRKPAPNVAGREGSTRILHSTTYDLMHQCSLLHTITQRCNIVRLLPCADHWPPVCCGEPSSYPLNLLSWAPCDF